jgi:hypothetical protein
MIISIDPGTIQSAVVVIDQGVICWPETEIASNESLLLALHSDAFFPERTILVIEQIQSYGMAVGAEIFRTVWWTGRFHEAFGDAEYLPRKDVKLHLCGTSRAKDKNIKAALVERFGHPGTKKNPGWMYGIKKDLWAALAVGVTWLDLNDKGWDWDKRKIVSNNVQEVASLPF